MNSTLHCTDQAGIRKAFIPRTANNGLWAAAALLLLLIATFALLGIPLKLPYARFLGYYFILSLQSTAYALILAGIGFPKEVLRPIWVRYSNSRPRTLIFITLMLLFIYIYPPRTAIVLSVGALTILELYDRGISVSTLCQPILPAIYLLIGLIMVFGYNAVAVTVRFQPNFDSTLQRVDSFLLFGHSVQGIAHGFGAIHSRIVPELAVWSYFALFAQIGAALILISLVKGWRDGIDFISTILLAYLLSLTIFFIFPTHSPYFTCPTHFRSHLPDEVLRAQRSLMTQASARWSGAKMALDTEYYVAFPCMHIAQPLIVLWFLRMWRRIVSMLVVVDVFLTAAIVLLEWHYVADLLGGVAVAVIAIAVMESFRRRANWLPGADGGADHSSANLGLN